MEIQLQELLTRSGRMASPRRRRRRIPSLRQRKSRPRPFFSDAQAWRMSLPRRPAPKNERLVRASEEAIRQAGRNLLISFRESVCRSWPPL